MTFDPLTLALVYVLAVVIGCGLSVALMAYFGETPRMTDFPACTLPGCPDPVATVIRRTSGEVDLVHNCHDGLYAQKFPSEARAAAHWAMTYARNAPAAPRSEAPEVWNGSAGKTTGPNSGPLLAGSDDGEFTKAQNVAC